MKLYIKTIIILTLFLTIASFDTYGRKLEIYKDTIVTYTTAENRAIAIMLRRGEYDFKRSELLDNIVVLKDSVISNQLHQIFVLQSNSDRLTSTLSDYVSKNDKLYKDLQKHLKREAKWQRTAFVSIGINVLLIAAIIML